MTGLSLIIGGTSGIGAEIAKQMSARGEHVVITGRDAARARSVAATIGKNVEGHAVDIAKPFEIAAAVKDLKNIRRLVIGAIERDMNTTKNYDIQGAINLVTMKVVGYTEIIHALLPQLSSDASIVLLGGLAKDRPYPGSTTVTAVNGAVMSMVRTLAVELAPIRVNAVHPGIIGDSPFWAGKSQALDRIIERTPLKRLATMEEVAHATLFLLDNGAMTGANLNVDGGWLLM
jgi:NAD(P)-dependent dehydrogenase (short-subunit alcohol dehydrogenase family)